MPYVWQDPTDFEPKTRLYAADLDEIVNDLYYLREQLSLLWPVGVVVQWPNATAIPSNFLLCDGTVYANTAWPALAAKIGTTWGGVGGASFAVPDFRGRSPMGAGTGTGLTNRALGTLLGAETHVLTLAQAPAHSHTINEHVHSTNGHNTTHWHGLGGHYHGDEHDHAINHWHLANIGATRALHDLTHRHWGVAGTVAEGTEAGGGGAAAPVNVEGNANGAPNGQNISGWKRQGGNTGGPSGGSDAADRDHNHGNTNGASNRGTDAQGGGTAFGLLHPVGVTQFIIRAAA